MNDRALRPLVSLGMFDMMKGVALLFVIFSHSYQSFSADPSPAVALGGILFCTFFVTAGYGIRKKTLAKAAAQVSRMFLRPYLYTAAGTVLCYFAANLWFSRSFPGALVSAGRLLVGFALGQYPEAAYFGFEVGSVGPMWFLVATALGWILLSVLLKGLGEKGTGLIALLLALAAPFSALLPPLPFCLLSLTMAVPGLYIGYLAQSRGLLEKKCPVCLRLLLILCALIYGFSAMGYGPAALSVLCCLVGSYGFVYLFVRLNRRYTPLVGALEWLGHNSMLILSLHTIEYFAAHWHIFISLARSRCSFSPLVGALCLFVLRLCLILLAAKGIERTKEKL